MTQDSPLSQPQSFRSVGGSPSRDRHAFSLVEVLAAVSILAMLAVLLPVAGKITKSGQRAQCASNLRQMGVALNSYLAENNMQLPTSWVSLPATLP